METNPIQAVKPIVENRKVEFMYNPMTNYSKSDWDNERLTMKSTWIDYTNWKSKIEEHFDQVEQLPNIRS